MRAALAACALVAAGCAHRPAVLSDDAAALVAAERAFAAASVASDMRAAFLANFSPEGVFLRDGWVNAHEALRDRPAPPFTLDWRPRHVEVARAGDLGVSTGPWMRTSRLQAGTAPAHGHFVSIWRRQEDGAWKVEVDLGISHAAAEPLDGGIEVVPPPAAATSDTPLGEAEARFIQTSMHSGVRTAYAEQALAGMRLYREGYEPVSGREAALDSEPLRDERIVWFADRLAVSRSHDFGYVRGSYADAAEPDRVRGYFVRVWRRERDGWRIALDVANPAR